MILGWNLLRVTVLGLALSALAWAAPGFKGKIEKLEAQLQGRIGLFAMRGPAVIAHRPRECFAYCSTFKWVLGAAVLKRVDEGHLDLRRKVNYSEKDLLSPSPVTAPQVAKGFMSIGDLCAATIITSDNTAANLLEPLVGGPSGLQLFVRNLGDSVMRFDRMEPE